MKIKITTILLFILISINMYFIQIGVEYFIQMNVGLDTTNFWGKLIVFFITVNLLSYMVFLWKNWGKKTNKDYYTND